jgi:hypothetical protein
VLPCVARSEEDPETAACGCGLTWLGAVCGSKLYKYMYMGIIFFHQIMGIHLNTGAYPQRRLRVGCLLKYPVKLLVINLFLDWLRSLQCLSAV